MWMNDRPIFRRPYLTIHPSYTIFDDIVPPNENFKFQIQKTKKSDKNSDAVSAGSKRQGISASARSIASSYGARRLITGARDRGSQNQRLHSTFAERATNSRFGTQIPHWHKSRLLSTNCHNLPPPPST